MRAGERNVYGRSITGANNGRIDPIRYYGLLFLVPPAADGEAGEGIGGERKSEGSQ